MQIKGEAAQMISQLDKFKAEFGAVGHGGFGKHQQSAADDAIKALDNFVKSLAPLESLAKFFQTTTAKPRGAARKARDPNAPVKHYAAPKGTTGKTLEWATDKRGAGPGWYRKAKETGTLDKLEVK